MVDLMGQYSKIKNKIDRNIISSVESGRFINGPIVKEFSKNLSNYLNVKNVIPCANGTDALQIAFMALDLKAGEEVVLKLLTNYHHRYIQPGQDQMFNTLKNHLGSLKGTAFPWLMKR